jgi:adenine-specific DNA-methyltransferase
MIEGDNLEVLKLLQKSYAGKVKMIYIDPPYNTGNDFIYPDNFRESLANYLRLTGQADAEGPTSTHQETTGRFHTVWLNMIYPRLKVARDLLRVDGVMFISIDDAEIVNLRYVCNEIFGEDNFLACFVRRRRMATGMRDTPVSPDHEYVVAYARNLAAVRLYGTARNEADFPFEDTRSRYRSTDLTIGMTRDMRPNQYYSIRNPRTGVEYMPPAERVWRFEPTTMGRQISLDNIIWPDDNPAGRMSRPRFKTRFGNSEENAKTNPVSTWIDTKARQADIETEQNVIALDAGLNQEATKEVRDLFGEQLLEYPKPVSLIMALCGLASRDDDIVLDFFAGSGTSGHAVWAINERDGGNRRFILVQLPESTGRDDYSTISEITKERLRRAGQLIHSQNPLTATDTGFRTFSLASSNIRVWNGNPEDLNQLLIDSVDRLEIGRTEGDILYELLHRLGFDLCAKVEARRIADKSIHAIADGRVVACLSKSIGRNDVEQLAQGIADWHNALGQDMDTVCVFLDTAFEDDVAKANMVAILGQHGLLTVRSI